MKKVYLCGHTGSTNRGCEAIISSTVDILNVMGESDVTLLSFNKKADESVGLDKKVKIIAPPSKSILKKGISYIKRKLSIRDAGDFEYLYKNIFKYCDENTVIFNVGGDTYCYDTPYISYALNNLAKRNAVPNVFWGCSVNEKTLDNPEMIDDLNKYTNVVVREKLSQEVFQKCMRDFSKVYKTCDPAFHLAIKETALPEGFVDKNTLGINISPVMFADYNNDNDMMYQNVHCLIDHVLTNTEMSICLIPHVYNIEHNTQDIMILKKIYAKYVDNKRVSLVDKELSASELKYIISRCRYFIGARTHSTIAAYSTSVPCIALSYSIKSRGIATDLFGTDVGYAIPYKGIKNAEEIKDAFCNTLVANENEIIERYREILPDYKQSIIDATREIVSKL